MSHLCRVKLDVNLVDEGIFSTKAGVKVKEQWGRLHLSYKEICARENEFVWRSQNIVVSSA